MTDPIEPLTMPAMSPITSLQKFEITEELEVHHRAVFAPFTFFAAIELKVVGFAVVTETPIISKIIPVKIKSSKIIIATKTLSSDVAVSETTERAAEIAKDIIKTFTIQPAADFFLGFFFCSSSLGEGV